MRGAGKLSRIRLEESTSVLIFKLIRIESDCVSCAHTVKNH